MKKLFAIALVLAMVLSMSVTAFATDITNEDYAGGTNTADVSVTYEAKNADEDAANDETWTVTIPASATASATEKDITVSGSFSPAKTLKVTAPEKVTLYINGDDTKDKVVLDVAFDGISLAGSYTETSVSATEPFSIQDMSNIKFGTWTGILTFNIEMTDTKNYTASDVLNK